MKLEFSKENQQILGKVTIITGVDYSTSQDAIDLINALK